MKIGSSEPPSNGTCIGPEVHKHKFLPSIERGCTDSERSLEAKSKQNQRAWSMLASSTGLPYASNVGTSALANRSAGSLTSVAKASRASAE